MMWYNLQEHMRKWHTVSRNITPMFCIGTKPYCIWVCFNHDISSPQYPYKRLGLHFLGPKGGLGLLDPASPDADSARASIYRPSDITIRFSNIPFLWCLLCLMKHFYDICFLTFLKHKICQVFPKCTHSFVVILHGPEVHNVSACLYFLLWENEMKCALLFGARVIQTVRNSLLDTPTKTASSTHMDWLWRVLDLRPRSCGSKMSAHRNVSFR